MPTPYQIALLLARLLAALNLVAGAFLIAGAIIVAIIHMATAPMLDGVPYGLFNYGLFYLLAGVGILIFGKRIAIFAAKS